MHRALRFCKIASCNGIAESNGYCLAHQSEAAEAERAHQARADQKRGSASSRGYDWQWHRFRNKYLSEPGHQFCALHLDGGCTVIADVVDHIVPLADGGSKYDRNNLQPACNHCNVVKGRRVLRGSWVYGVDDK